MGYFDSMMEKFYARIEDGLDYLPKQPSPEPDRQCVLCQVMRPIASYPDDSGYCRHCGGNLARLAHLRAYEHPTGLGTDMLGAAR